MLMLLCYVWAHLQFHSLRFHKFLTPISFILDEVTQCRTNSFGILVLSSANIFKIKRTLEASFKQFQNYLGGLGNKTKFNVFLLMIGALPIA